MDSLDKMVEAAKQVSRDFAYRCTRAIGHTGYCSCLSSSVPVSLDFDHFIYFASRSKAEVKFDGMSKDQRSLYLKASDARNSCSKKLNFK